MKFARRDVTKLAGVAVATAALALAAPGTAAADEATDNAFMSKLFAQGIDFAPKAKAVERAQSVCEFFGEGVSSAEVYVKIFQGSAFSERQTAIFMADAVSTYCPQYANQFIR
jgi:Protein of unknown function (DUF732)